MKTLSLEYAHIYPGKNEDEEIKQANFWMPRIVKMFDDVKVQKCIMLDDIHTSKEVDDDYLQSLIIKLEVKPDCIYRESEFIYEASKMVDNINPKERDFIHSDEKIWLRESVDRFSTTMEFLLSWKDKNGEVKFSCPTLAAASYLSRLGRVSSDGIKPIYGDGLMVADQVLNVLSPKYLQVEDKAQSIIEATYKDALRKISWFFY